MIVSSSIEGVWLVWLYLLNSLFRLTMARFKNTLFDSISTGALTFLMSLPTIALVYIIRLIGSGSLDCRIPSYWSGRLCLYGSFRQLLGFWVPWTAVWFCRYMIDLQSQDFVRFARAKGLLIKKFQIKHIFKRHGTTCIQYTWVLLSELSQVRLWPKQFAFPWMGKMLIDLLKHLIILWSLVLFIFTCLSIFALLLGDILMTMLDPRIKLTSKEVNNGYNW